MQRCEECTDVIDCIRYRQETHAENYSFLAFVGYFFYPPLFIAGPTLAYNAWISQVIRPQQTFSLTRKLTYLLRIVFALCLLELSIHFLYFPSIANSEKHKHLWTTFSAYEMAIVSYLILNWIWYRLRRLKFLVIWRFFRLWAIMDGIESVENLSKCMSNSYSLEEFWRMWHRAFNQWLIRYLFIPLGGSKYKMYNVWAVFGFVAIWHDLTLHLLVWGWGICVILVPEMVLKAFFNGKRFDEFRKTIAYNWLCACAGATTGFTLIFVNMVGFSYGIDGLSAMFAKLTAPSGLLVLGKCWFFAVLEVHFLRSLKRTDEKVQIRDGKAD